MNPISSQISWRFQKHKHLVDGLLLRKAPSFVYRNDPPHLSGEIPVFTFHLALPELFERQCRHLAENGYRTLSSEEFLHVLTTPRIKIEKSVVLTFDDGLKHVWTVAYPLLKKYGLKATCFLIPGCIPENDLSVRPTLEDVWRNGMPIQDILKLGCGSSALATWPEIRIMHESGVLDFQSHTMYHSLVFSSDKIFDFLHPNYDTHFYGNIHIPVYQIDGTDIVSRKALIGMPIYFSQPRMSAAKRFFDDENIRRFCIQVVRREGQDDFFRKSNWRQKLRREVTAYRKRNPVRERYETVEERDKAVLAELRNSRHIIEEKLPGRKVLQLCYPWYEANDFAAAASKQAGFKANYFGLLTDRYTNQPGDNPFRIVRLEELFLQRLPGTGRKSLRAIFKILKNQRKVSGLVGLAD
jgi:peptidoglycan/xylan/chitin deacetylase (PgdA/CDA1 family)